VPCRLSTLGETYQPAMTSRLPRSDIVSIESAMSRLEEINATAAAVTAANIEGIARLNDLVAARTVAEPNIRTDADKIIKGYQRLVDKEVPLRISNEDHLRLLDVADEFAVVRKQLGDRTPAMMSDENLLAWLTTEDGTVDVGRTEGGVPVMLPVAQVRGDDLKRVLYNAGKAIDDQRSRVDRRVWLALHKRAAAIPFIVAALTVLGIVVADQLTQSLGERTDEAERVLAHHISGESLTVCESVKDRESRFECVVTMPVAGSNCPTEQTASAAIGGTVAWAQQPNCEVDSVLHYVVTNGAGHRCFSGTETGRSQRGPPPEPPPDPSPRRSLGDLGHLTVSERQHQRRRISREKPRMAVD
jgi:hypothetical protein